MAGYDIHFQPVPKADVRGFKIFTFGFSAALKVKGPQALVNRWAKTYLTPKGSDPLDLDSGTSFASIIGGNITKITQDLYDLAQFSLQDANAQVKEQDIAGLFPDNESLSMATITNFVETADGIELWVEIQTVSGEVLTVRLIDLADR
jgi:hypothetical protein